MVILLAILAWIGVFGELGLESERVPAIGSSLHNMGGTILFNFMLLGPRHLPFKTSKACLKS